MWDGNKVRLESQLQQPKTRGHPRRIVADGLHATMPSLLVLVILLFVTVFLVFTPFLAVGKTTLNFKQIEYIFSEQIHREPQLPSATMSKISVWRRRQPKKACRFDCDKRDLSEGEWH